MSLTTILSTEGIEEVKNLLNSKNYYVGVNGKMVFSSDNDVSRLVFQEMSN